MIWFKEPYESVRKFARHKYASTILGCISFLEAFIFPLPPDFLLIPMSVMNKKRAWFYAFVTTMASVAGGLLGYIIGMMLYESVGIWIIELYGMQQHFGSFKNWYADYGMLMIFIAGFLPIPYKVFTIASGVFAMALTPFILGSLFGRATRFFFVSALCYWASDSVQVIMQKFGSKVMIIATVLLVAAIVYLSI